MRDLFRRFPRRGSRIVSDPIMPPAAKAGYPALAEDFEALRPVEERFERYDLEALRGQRSYRLQGIVVLLGSALLTGLGGLQAVLSDQRWPSAVLAVLAVALAGVSQFVVDDHALADYRLARVKAERLRALYFIYLARVEPYTGDNRARLLVRAVDAIDEGEELT
ncbi:hypothetical protein GCM10009827_113440 [Dactylosporangium maewongense]|uniref:SMODS and SLOG-associating 2TM effector domain-containing protein n=2 Tax=Micromonosporaceae TaxID=28056 RepID=A0ABN2D9H3_9ACTN